MKSISKRNNVRILGRGDKTMVFAHGFGCDLHVWRYLVPAFADDYKIILFDYVGAGNSDLSAYDSRRYSSLDGYAQDVLELYTELNIRDSIFIGHSVSSMIGLLSALQEPSFFEKLIFVGPSPRYLNDTGYTGGFERQDMEALFEIMDSNYLGWARTLAPAIMGNAERPELGEELTQNFCATDPEIAKEFARVTFFSDNRKDLPNLQVPSLTLQCSEDIIAPLEVGYYIEKNTPYNSLVIMEAQGHCPHMSAPAETIQAVKAYL